jgi:exodeoxyribonuclease VII small subunit
MNLSRMPTDAPDRTSTSPASFEASIARLSEIVEQLERGEMPLEESLRLFEEGVKLSRTSQERLDRAQKKVEELLRVDADGAALTAPFVTADDDR